MASVDLRRWRGTLAAMIGGALMGQAVGAAPASPLRSSCDTGRRQSPVDIRQTQREALPALQFEYRPAPLRAVNDGHTVRVRLAHAGRLRVGADTLTLTQFHFHVPGGDRIHGEEFAMAMHFLHKSGAGQLVPVVVLYRVGAESPALARLLPQLPTRAEGETVRPGVPVDPAAFLPSARGYFRYEGSETAPPCTEGVRWLVLKTPLELSAGQLAQLTRLIPPNARPVQPLNGRVVQESP